MLEELKAADEEQLLALEEEFRELTLKEAEIFEQLTEVRAAKQRVRRLVAEKKNRYAPIFKLPDELLVCICEAGQNSTDFDRPPLEVLASHVSQRFRWAVISAPSLWSSIRLRWGVKSDAARFATYLERSRARTLSVTCKYASYCGKEECDYDDVHNELPTISANISRIRRLVFECGGMGMSLDDAVAHFSDLRAPCLEYVEISVVVSELDESDNYVPVFGEGAPLLTTLKLTNAFPDYWGPWLLSLTSLDLQGMHGGTSTYVLPMVLSSCPQLIDLTLDDSTFFTSNPPLTESNISLPFLRSLKGLCLHASPDGLVGGIIPHLHAPALEILQFSGVHGAQISGFFNLLPPAKFPTLRSLTFVNSSVPCKACHLLPQRILPQALRHFQNLASLTIVNICHLTLLLGDLLATPTDDGSLSALRTLTLRHRNADELGIASWPRLQSASVLNESDAHDPLQALHTLIATFRETRSLRLRLPRSRFFTERDWDQDDTNFEIFDPQPLLQSLGYDREDEISDLVFLEVE
ncbi:hypothetical protein FB451DRAFT_130105 [Mycena latifolia]|nr:hypothetical protein FB451DRAFT_130105 [Mycena latifolia]